MVCVERVCSQGVGGAGGGVGWGGRREVGEERKGVADANLRMD